MIKPETVNEARSRIATRLAATSPTTWAKLGGGLLLGGLAVGWIAFPYILDKIIAWQINLSQGKDSRRLWIQLPPFEFNIYVFNITNPDEIMNGAKPTVQQVGPYCYTEIKDKVDVIEDPSTDTISYSARPTWYENQKSPRCKAPQLTGDEILVVPNVPLLAILLLAQRDFPPALLALVNQALPAIFGPLADVFSRVTARRLLFGGIPIDCSAVDLAPRAVCIALKQNSRPLKKLGNNKYLFSFFGHKNNTPEEFRYTVKRGTQNGQEIGKLVALDGREELPFWRGACNRLQGTDATVFPPFRAMENGSLTAYSSEVCRIVFGAYEGQFDYKGVAGYGYSITFGEPESNSGDRCFCPADDRCRKDGVLDAFKCQGAPIVSSLPHFYQASDEYVTGVNGLRPDKEKHGILIVLEPISGSPLIVRKRLQFNIDLKPARFVPLTRRLRRTLLPLFWAEEMLDLDSELMGMLEASLFRPLRAVDVLKWGSVAAGVALAVGAAALHARRLRRDKVRALDADEAEAAAAEDGLRPRLVLRNEGEETTPEENSDPFYVQSHENSDPKMKSVQKVRLRSGGVEAAPGSTSDRFYLQSHENRDPKEREKSVPNNPSLEQSPRSVTPMTEREPEPARINSPSSARVDELILRPQAVVPGPNMSFSDNRVKVSNDNTSTEVSDVAKRFADSDNTFSLHTVDQQTMCLQEQRSAQDLDHRSQDLMARVTRDYDNIMVEDGTKNEYIHKRDSLTSSSCIDVDPRGDFDKSGNSPKRFIDISSSANSYPIETHFSFPIDVNPDSNTPKITNPVDPDSNRAFNYDLTHDTPWVTHGNVSTTQSQPSTNLHISTETTVYMKGMPEDNVFQQVVNNESSNGYKGGNEFEHKGEFNSKFDLGTKNRDSAPRLKNPTEEEMRLVEQDINQLVAEISQLFPKK